MRVIAASSRACRSTVAAGRATAAAAPPPPAPACRSTWQQRTQQQQRQHRRCLSPVAAAAGQAGSAPPGEEAGPEVPPTPEELAEAERMLQDFIDGLGASGMETVRPEDMDLPEGRLTWAEAVQIMGTSGWRLNEKLCPAIQELVTQVEGCWRGVLPEDQLKLYQLPERFRYLDSLDPEGGDEFSFRSMEDPEKGAPNYPRLQLENRAYSSRAFRKLHIEVAVRQDGLQVFHCVMFPRLEFDLPILSMDLVANEGRVSLAIVDPCPLTPDLQLPPFYSNPVSELQAKCQLESNRRVPDWGKAIFSPLCVIMRPESSEDLGRFLKYTLALTQLHVQIAKIAHPVSPAQRRRLAMLHAGHRRYCDKQLENDKTRRVLEAAFGPAVGEAYMKEVMFDCEPLPEGSA